MKNLKANMNMKPSYVSEEERKEKYKKLWFKYIISVLLKNNIQCNVLNTFNKKREENLNEIINACNVSRDTAKDLILRITFLGSIEEFIMVNQIQGTIPKFVYELSDEFKLYQI